MRRAMSNIRYGGRRGGSRCAIGPAESACLGRGALEVADACSYDNQEHSIRLADGIPDVVTNARVEPGRPSGTSFRARISGWSRKLFLTTQLLLAAALNIWDKKSPARAVALAGK